MSWKFRCTPNIIDTHKLEARVGIEPTNEAFAEPCLTTWLPRPTFASLVCWVRRLKRKNLVEAGVFSPSAKLPFSIRLLPSRSREANFLCEPSSLERCVESAKSVVGLPASELHRGATHCILGLFL